VSPREAMRRREFVTLLSVAAVAYPLTARARQAGKLPTVVVLGDRALVWDSWTAGDRETLRQRVRYRRGSGGSPSPSAEA
jgi:hypothetical protein